MRRVYLIIAMVLIVGILPALTFAYPGRGGRGPMGGKWHKGDPNDSAGCAMLLRLKDKLELSDEQVKQLEAVKTEVADQFKASYETVKAKRQALRTAVQSAASEDTIRAAANELGAAIGDKAILKAGTKTKVDAILTDAQKTKLQELKEQRKERWQERIDKGERPMRRGRGRGMPKDPEEVFAKIDTDGNGTLSLDEFKAHMEQMKARRGDKAKGCPTPPEPDEDQ